MIEQKPSEQKNTKRGKDRRKVKTIEAKTDSAVHEIAGKGQNSARCARICSCEKFKNAFHLISLNRESKHMLSLFVTQRVCETNSLSKPKNPDGTRYSEVSIREKRSTRGIESYVWFKKFWRSVSQKRMSQEIEEHEQNIFFPSNVNTSRKRKQWKSHKEDKHKKKPGKFTLLH